ncbi:hypothetical protein BH10CYA1_BH10CYA1_60720 [soil metagenome]
MSKLYAIVDGAGQRLFSIIAPSLAGEITVLGIPGSRVETSNYDPATFEAAPLVNYTGRILTLQFGDDWSATDDELTSHSKLEVSDPLPNIRLVFEETNHGDGVVSLSAARARKN